MKEETRKTLAIWLLGIGIGINILKNFIPPMICFEAIGMNIFEMTKEEWAMMFNLFSLFFILIVGGFCYGSVLTLKRLLNTVTYRFFNRFIVAFVMLPIVLCIISIVLSLFKVDIPYWLSVISVIAGMIVMMSGAGVIRKNYILDTCLTSKLRLFQTGVLFTFSTFAVTAIWGYFQYPACESIDYRSMIQPMGWVNWVLSLGGYVCLFLGLKGIIRSDLLGESRKEDVFEQVGGGWGERPVIGAIGYCVFLLIFTILAFQTVVTY